MCSHREASWRVRSVGEIYRELIVTSDSGDVCHVLGIPMARREALAAMLANAPALLRACSEAAEYLRAFHGEVDVAERSAVLRSLDDAIVAATTTSPEKLEQAAQRDGTQKEKARD